MRKIDAARVLELFTYDAATGALFWRKRATEGPVGTLTHKGYVTIPIEGKNYRAHRIVWAMHYGDTIPEGMMIDHINGDRADNRVENLRLATPRQNALNTHSKAASASGFRGVTRRRGENKWRAQIRIDGKQTSLGYFHTPEEAHAAYCKAAAEMHGEFARRDSVLVAEGLERDAREVADSLIDTMIDISESNEDCEFTEEGHRKAVSMAQEAIRQNEWFWGGRPKPAPQPQEAACQHKRSFGAPWRCAKCGHRYDDDATPPAHGDGEGEFARIAASKPCPACGSHGPCEDAQRCMNTVIATNFRGETFAEARQQLVNVLKAQKSWVTGYAESYVDEFADMASTRPTPEAQEARDEVDARRYRYLRDHCKREWYSDMPHNKGAPSLDIEFEARGHDLDAAIDAALALPAQGGVMAKVNPWTPAELRKFDQLTEAVSSPNGHTRVIARLDLKRFVEEVGKEKCDAMFAHLTERDKKRGRNE